MSEALDSDVQSLKIVLGGRYGVGKTSLRRSFMGGRIKRNYLPTVGSDFSYKDVNVNGEKITVLLWDLAGETRFRKFRSLYFQGALGAIMVFDLTDEESFENLYEWVEDLKNETETNGIPMVVVGNKSDLILDVSEQCVTDEEIQEALREFTNTLNPDFEVRYFEVSALTGKNVQAAFSSIIESSLKFKQDKQVVSG